jgi:hypothetical protein
LRGWLDEDPGASAGSDGVSRDAEIGREFVVFRRPVFKDVKPAASAFELTAFTAAGLEVSELAGNLTILEAPIWEDCWAVSRGADRSSPSFFLNLSRFLVRRGTSAMLSKGQFRVKSRYRRAVKREPRAGFGIVKSKKQGNNHDGRTSQCRFNI